jgi:hypothetical protein
LDGEVEAFGGPGGEDDVSGGSAYQVSDVAGGLFDGGFSAIAHFMIEAASIAKALGHAMQNFLSNPRINGSGSVVVEVNQYENLIYDIEVWRPMVGVVAL